MSLKKRSLKVEGLEDRQLMAGDVTAALSGNVLTISEAAGHIGESNQVIISQLSNGKIHVAGYTNNGNPSKINGMTSVDFTIPGGSPANLVVNLGASNDRLVISPGTKLNDVNINMSAVGAGVNDVDTVDIQGLTTNGSMNIKTGDGVDNVFVQNSKIGDGIGNDDLNINTGTGWDYVQVGNTNSYSEIKGSLNIQTYDSINELGGSGVKVQLTTARDYIRINGDAGIDTVDMLADVAGEDVVVATNDGNDTVTMRDCQAVDQYFVLLGNGDDTLDMQNTRANTLYADGGAGLDTLKHYYDGPTNQTTYAGFDTMNGVRVRPVTTAGPIATSGNLGRIA